MVSVQRIAEKSCLLGRGNCFFVGPKPRTSRSGAPSQEAGTHTRECEDGLKKKNQDRTRRLNETSAKHAENDATVADR